MVSCTEMRKFWSGKFKNVHLIVLFNGKMEVKKNRFASYYHSSLIEES